MTQTALAPASDRARHDQMANALRALAMDAVEAAKSGHPGMPMGMADVATVLFSRFLKFDPRHPRWPDRDRVVLSAGHGSMLLYGALHLTGFADFPLDALKRFRQLGSVCAGHPEFGHGAGVETTTGPLGQGLGNAVGMALAEEVLRARFGAGLVDHYTYVIAGDGDLMEGISHESIGLAGHLRLKKLIVLLDDNGITIDGPLSLSETGDYLARFEAAGWNAVRVDGHDPEAIAAAITAAQGADRPSLIACRTIIGYGAPNKQGTSATHGSPLGAAEVAAAREQLGWPHAPFEIPEQVRTAWNDAGRRGQDAHAAWTERLAATDAEQRAAFERALSGELPPSFAAAIDAHKRRLVSTPVAVATRKASELALEVINPAVPEMVGGSADLTESNLVRTKGLVAIEPGDFAGRMIHYGIREHGMAAAMNGMALHGGVIPYGGTFLVFSDYCRPSIRLSALMGVRVIYVMTHDSIGVGEDGPTHQPVEHLAALRAIPNLNVFRPADAVEAAECWQLALQDKTRPSVLALSRQAVPQVRLADTDDNLCARGAYELLAAGTAPRVTLIATGTEIEIAVAARTALEAEGIGTRVVSMPSWSHFAAQPADYHAATLGHGTLKIAIEAASPFGWERWIGPDGLFIGMEGFGASGPAKDVYRHFGITAEAVVAAARARL